MLARERWWPAQGLAGHFEKIVIGLAQQILHRPAHFVFLTGIHRNRERRRGARMLLGLKAFCIFDIMIIHMDELNSGGRRRIRERSAGPQTYCIEGRITCKTCSDLCAVEEGIQNVKRSLLRRLAWRRRLAGQTSRFPLLFLWP